MKKFYPAFLSLEGRRAVVVGGGKVAERKVFSLLDAGALVRVISPIATPHIRRLAGSGRIELEERQYLRGDLKDAFLVVAATDNPEINARVGRDAPSLVNVIDAPDLSNFIVPSSIRRGDLTIAISTGGASPALARSIRIELESLYGPEFGRYLARVKRQRKRALERITGPAERRVFLMKLGAEKGLLARIRRGGREDE